MDFIDEPGDQPWCLHLSYIKPHWPYIAPAPYHAMYGPRTCCRLSAATPSGAIRIRCSAAFMELRVSRAFSRDEVRAAVIPAYMGLINQIDDQMGVLIEVLSRRGLLDSTMIVFTSDHGDYLGDHWMGEKDFFHEPSVKIPLIVVDPSRGRSHARNDV